MPLMILGLIFAVGLFLFYLFSTSSSGGDEPKKDPPEDDDLKTEENVIFLPDDIQKMKDKRNKKK